MSSATGCFTSSILRLFQHPENSSRQPIFAKSSQRVRSYRFWSIHAGAHNGPTPNVVDLHVLVGTVRKQILTEDHPAVLQTYIACATVYGSLSNLPAAQKYYYLSTKISSAALSDIHPLTVDCANRFLSLTESLTFTTRTETVQYREEVLIILITAYERQHGASSDIVVRTRKLLAELYASINDEERAAEIYRLILKHTDKHSHEAQDAQQYLNVKLGKRGHDQHVDEYKDLVFTNDEEEEVVELFDLEQVVAYLHRAETQSARGEILLAEKTFVELWQEVSSKCRTVRSVEWHEKHIDVALAYSKFLQTQNRSAEATAVLTVVWQQYEHHQLSFTESIVSRLTTVARMLRTMGHYSIALTIFNYASSYFKSVRKESKFSTEIDQEISQTSVELVKRTLSSTTSTTTTSVSESVFQDAFYSVIKTSQSIDSTTVTLAKKLTISYIEQSNWTAAISVIKETLQRTWSSFISGSVHDVVLTSTFRHESIELVEHLAESYLRLKQIEKAEDTYRRLFQAVLRTQDVDQQLLHKVVTLLVTFYDKHGSVDSAISVYQELLVVYRARLGLSHEKTIQILYSLASRCRSHPRNHPYWIEYYQQIVNILNKDLEICHKDALDAIVIVATTHWEDRRYAEAVIIYAVLWNTFVRKTKEYKQFSEISFVQSLYERYFQCLEETKASWETLHKVTSEYRQTSITVFGRQSTIAVEATLALARVTQRSEEHATQAISLYEEVSQSSTSVTTTSTTEISQILSSLYVRQMRSQSSSSFKAETVERAVSMTLEQFNHSVSKYGYSHESSLTQLRELTILYHRQQKTDIAVKKLTSAVVEIITKETSTQKSIEAAASIAESFKSVQQVEHCHTLVQELHRQIIARDSRYVSKWSFDLTKSDRTALAILASIQYNIRTDLSVTFSEVLADITAEYIYYEHFKRTLTGKQSMRSILLATAPLRWFLRHIRQQELVTAVEDDVATLFKKRDAADLNVMSPDSPRIFIVSILEHLGNGKNKNFNRSVIAASNEQVASLTKAKKFLEAYDIANLGFIFAANHDGYNGPRNIGQGFKLASLLVGLDGERSPDPALRKKTLALSNQIVKKILNICKELKINFAQVQIGELNQLSVLLGEQQDYTTLEVSPQGQRSLFIIIVLTVYPFSVASLHALEHTRCSTIMARYCAYPAGLSTHLRTVPCWSPGQSHPALRRYHLQYATHLRASRTNHN